MKFEMKDICYYCLLCSDRVHSVHLVGACTVHTVMAVGSTGGKGFGLGVTYLP